MGIPVNIPIVGGNVPSMANPVDGMNWGSLWGETKDIFAMGANTWLNYQQGKRTGDFSGANQREVYETPTTAQPQPNPQQVQPIASIGGVPVTYLAIGGLLLVGAVIVAKS